MGKYKSVDSLESSQQYEEDQKQWEDDGYPNELRDEEERYENK